MCSLLCEILFFAFCHFVAGLLLSDWPTGVSPVSHSSVAVVKLTGSGLSFRRLPQSNIVFWKDIAAPLRCRRLLGQPLVLGSMRLPLKALVNRT